MMSRVKLLSVLLASAALAFPAAAMGPSRTVRVDVPFAWSAGNTQLPAGKYRLHKQGMHRVQVRDAAGEVRAVLVTLDGERQVRNDARLVFNKYGERRFLAKVEGPGFGCQSVPSSRAEREASAGYAEIQRYTIDADVK